MTKGSNSQEKIIFVTNIHRKIRFDSNNCETSYKVNNYILLWTRFCIRNLLEYYRKFARQNRRAWRSQKRFSQQRQYSQSLQSFFDFFLLSTMCNRTLYIKLSNILRERRILFLFYWKKGWKNNEVYYYESLIIISAIFILKNKSIENFVSEYAYLIY